MSSLSFSRERVIWKYEIPLVNSFEIDLPDTHKVLHVSEQHGTGCLWVVVDPTEPRTATRFQLIASEQTFDTAFVGEYIGTYFLNEKMLTVHLFESPESTRSIQ
jgi:hypothetical protein